jgi:hypothetical protein
MEFRIQDPENFCGSYVVIDKRPEKGYELPL